MYRYPYRYMNVKIFCGSAGNIPKIAKLLAHVCCLENISTEISSKRKRGIISVSVNQGPLIVPSYVLHILGCCAVKTGSVSVYTPSCTSDDLFFRRKSPTSEVQTQTETENILSATNKN